MSKGAHHRDHPPAPVPSGPEAVRNVVLVGPGGAGKSTLFNHLVGARVPGRRAHEGEPERSVGLTVASVESHGLTVNLIDTPGHPDFVGELRAGLRAADAAIFVISAADGVDGVTALLWHELAALGVPRAVAVSKLDLPRSDFEETVATCQRVFGDAQPLYLPVHDAGTAVVASLGLLGQQVFDSSSGERVARAPTRDEASAIEARRSALIEAIIEQSEDDTLLDRYVEGAEIETDLLVEDLRAAVGTATFFPVVPISAATGVGLEEVFELVEQCFPSPAARPLPIVYSPAGATLSDVSCDPDGPLVAEVIRTSSDPYVGRLSLVRLFSGTLRPDDTVHVSGHLGQFVGHALEGHLDHDDEERVGPQIGRAHV